MSVLDHFEDNFVFRSRPEAIPGDFRPLWRMTVVLLILKLASRSNSSTLSRLHVLNWAIRTQENRENIRFVIAGDVPPDKIVVRIEPSLIRALELANGEGLIEYLSGKTVKLTDKGIKVADEILGEPYIFAQEKLFLQEIGKSSLTEQVINRMFSEEFR